MDATRAQNEKITLRQRLKKWPSTPGLLMLAFVLQMSGFLYSSYADGSSFSNLFFYQLKFSDHWALSIERAMLTVALLCMPLLILNHLKYFFSYYIIFFIFPPVYHHLAYNDPNSLYNLLGAGIRVFLPLSLFFMFHRDERLRNAAKFTLRLGLSFTFLGHGLKCLNHYATFADYLFYFFDEITGTGIHPNTVDSILHLIGMMDVSLAVLAIVLPRKWVFIYMGIWGAVTALFRITYFGQIGMADFFFRASHFLVPLYLVLHSNKVIIFQKIKGMMTGSQNAGGI